ILVEGAGAMGPASLLAGSIEGISGKKVVCVLSGGNIDSTIVGPSIEKGLVSDHRLVMFEVLLPDRSGSICDLFELAARTGASVKHTAVEHVFHRFGMFAGKCKVIVETRGLDHCVELKEALSKRLRACVTRATTQRKRCIDAFVTQLGRRRNARVRRWLGSLF
ncbi:hypothetical protein ANCDUO_17853, partial [Ancylostoma duodenale]